MRKYKIALDKVNISRWVREEGWQLRKFALGTARTGGKDKQCRRGHGQGPIVVDGRHLNHAEKRLDILPQP